MALYVRLCILLDNMSDRCLVKGYSKLGMLLHKVYFKLYMRIPE